MKRSERRFCNICNQIRKFKFGSRYPTLRHYKYCSFCNFQIYSSDEFEYYVKDKFKNTYILHLISNSLMIEIDIFERFRLKPEFVFQNISFEDYIGFCKNKSFIKKIK